MMKLSEFPEHTVITYLGSRYIKTPSVWEPFSEYESHLTYTEVDYNQRVNPGYIEILSISWEVVQVMIAQLQDYHRDNYIKVDPTEEYVIKDAMDTLAEAKRMNLDITPEQKKEAARLRAEGGKS